MALAAETSELIAFTKTVDAKSLSRAAAELGIPRATLSRRIAQLEKSWTHVCFCEQHGVWC
ncbi:MAG: LysR family transcriptional regulator [Pantoea dispersa]|mgnify:CR=1 FL=1|jgi:DNA-binding transcriptional LysR family regulator|nr:LysR family transcriptional regulator [Pantoea dispersa]